MPTVYKVEILNHLVDGYESAQNSVREAERWLAVRLQSEREAWDEALDTTAPNRAITIAHRHAMEATQERYAAEHERDVAQLNEQRAMRVLSDAVLLAAKGANP